jgi:hypothetical protein
MKRVLAIGIWIAAAVVLAGVGGFYIGWHSALKTVPATDMFVAAQRETYLSVLRNHGDDESYEAALRSQLSFLDALHARNRDRSDQWSYNFDRALTLARLSTLAQKRGASDEAASLARDAEALCPKTGLRNCSISALVQAAYKIDNGLLGEPEEPK